jgi:hypothetical protein
VAITLAEISLTEHSAEVSRTFHARAR